MIIKIFFSFLCKKNIFFFFSFESEKSERKSFKVFPEKEDFFLHPGRKIRHQQNRCKRNDSRQQQRNAISLLSFFSLFSFFFFLFLSFSFLPFLSSSFLSLLFFFFSCFTPSRFARPFVLSRQQLEGSFRQVQTSVRTTSNNIARKRERERERERKKKREREREKEKEKKELLLLPYISLLHPS